MTVDLTRRYRAVRAQTEALAEPLSEADAQVQSMPDASPTKWHLAHTTWFFETFVLEAAEPGFQPFQPAFRVLYNSYYHGVGEQHPRPQRGLVTRPSLAEVRQFRRQVDERMLAVLARGCSPGCAALVELGLQHEQQHQELILTDLLHLLSCNPLAPAYLPAPTADVAEDPGPLDFLPQSGGLCEIGHAGAGFAFDNEAPRHRVYVAPWALARRLVTVGEWQQFMADGAYREPRWWLSAGWDWVQRLGVTAPLYWRGSGGGFTHRFGLHGLEPLRAAEPVLHVSLFEADAFARWWSAQHPQHPPLHLPTEAQWESAAEAVQGEALARGVYLESARRAPRAAAPGAEPQQLFGHLWQWTASAYQAYPGFRAWEGAVGEYNAKFMVNQYVLRGGSFATPRSHIRASYRNFFPAETRWQFSGVRLVHAT